MRLENQTNVSEQKCCGRARVDGMKYVKTAIFMLLKYRRKSIYIQPSRPPGIPAAIAQGKLLPDSKLPAHGARVAGQTEPELGRRRYTTYQGAVVTADVAGRADVGRVPQHPGIR